MHCFTNAYATVMLMSWLALANASWPRQPKYQLKKQQNIGDINIAALLIISKYGPRECSNETESVSFLTETMGLPYFVRLINENSNILPNLTLGYQIEDICLRLATGLTKATSMVNIMNKDANIHAVTCPTSATCSGISAYMGEFQIPTISSSASSNSLSDIAKYPYFLRVLPPDSYQAKAMVSLLSKYGWSYVSTIHHLDDYGTNGVRWIKHYTKESGICIDFSGEVTAESTAEEWDSVVGRISKSTQVNVIILFGHPADITRLLHAIKRLGGPKRYVFIMSETATGGEQFQETGYKELSLGTFVTALDLVQVDYIQQYVDARSPLNIQNNPWAKRYWQEKHDCSWMAGERNKKSCFNTTTLGDAETVSTLRLSAAKDMVDVLAMGMHNHLSKDCPRVFRNKSLLPECLDGDRYLSEMKALEFQGTRGNVRFDNNGDMLGNYKILQFQKRDGAYMIVEIGGWSMETNTITIADEIWPFGTEENRTVPESICSKPCKKGEFRLQREPKCCWECRRCRENEITVKNETDCEPCPTYFWPDEHKATCLRIEPTHITWKDSLVITITIICSLGVFITICIAAFYMKHRREKLMKASSIRISMLILIGAFIGYGTGLVVLVKPVTAACIVSLVGFAVSCTICYAALFVKTMRVYRIFKSSQKGAKRLLFTSDKSQVAIIMILLLGQIIMLAISVPISPPTQRRVMPSPVEKFVELQCHLPLACFIPPLLYNILLLLCATYVGFKARKLPANFNESWYIFIIACMTLFLWLAFLTTFFVAKSGYHKSILLSLVLFFNPTITIVCLFLPKFFAIYFVEEENLNINYTPTVVGTSASNYEMGEARQRRLATIEAANKELDNGNGAPRAH